RKVARLCQEQFDRRMSEELGRFRKWGSTIPGINAIYEMKVAPELWFFVHLHIIPQDEGFTLELAYNSQGEFPWIIPRERDESPINGAFRIRLMDLMIVQKEGKQPIWQFAETKPISFKKLQRVVETGIVPKGPAVPNDKVIEVVDKAFEDLLTHGIPF